MDADFSIGPIEVLWIGALLSCERAKVISFEAIGSVSRVFGLLEKFIHLDQRLERAGMMPSGSTSMINRKSTQ